MFLLKVSHCINIVRIRSYSGPYFHAFGLNKERYSVSLGIVQIREDTDQNKPEYGHIPRSEYYSKRVLHSRVNIKRRFSTPYFALISDNFRSTLHLCFICMSHYNSNINYNETRMVILWKSCQFDGGYLQ